MLAACAKKRGFTAAIDRHSHRQLIDACLVRNQSTPAAVKSRSLIYGPPTQVRWRVSCFEKNNVEASLEWTIV